MKTIDIQNQNGHLVLTRYDAETKKKELQIFDNDVITFLEKITNYSIKGFSIREKDNKETAIVKYNGFNIRIHDSNELGKKAELLEPLFQECSKFTEKEKLKELKDKNTSIPKVNRENKYADKKTKILKTTLCVLSAATIAAVSIFATMVHKRAKDASGITHEDIMPDISVSDMHDFSKEPIKFTNMEDANNDLVIMDNVYDVEEKEGIFIDYEDLSEAKRALQTKEKYGALIEKYSTIYGLDPNLMIAIAIQERGEHSSVMDKGGATGIMQMQNGVWIGEKISAYNYETGEKDAFMVTKDNIGDLETNIQMGCMCFQNNLEYYDYNIPLAIQAYNYGMGNLNKVIDAYASATGKTRQEVISDPHDVGWMDYRYIIDVGCETYLNGVMSWMGNSNDISVMKRDNTSVDLTIGNNVNLEKTY